MGRMSSSVSLIGIFDIEKIFLCMNKTMIKAEHSEKIVKILTSLQICDSTINCDKRDGSNRHRNSEMVQ